MSKLILKSAGISLAAALAFSGCMGLGGEKEPTKEKSSYVDPEFDGAPSWVMMPMVEGAIADVGSAQKNAGGDRSLQRAEALANARDNLAQQLSVKVNNMFKSYKATTGAGESGSYDKSVESVSKQIASETLSGSKMTEWWISKTGTLYVLVVLDSSIVKQQMEESIKSSFKDDKAMYQKFLADKADGELDAELEKAAQ